LSLIDVPGEYLEDLISGKKGRSRYYLVKIIEWLEN
jgi:hypothetical protein